MLEYEIYDEAPEEAEETTTVRLALEYNYDGSVSVVAVDEDGEKVFAGNLITFTPEGRVSLCPAVNRYLGFDLDKYERIKLDD